MSDTFQTDAIERRDKLDYREFVRDYLRPHRPVVITNCLKEWRANGTWTPAFFREHYGEKIVRIDREYRLAEYIDLVEASTSELPAPYLFHLLIDENFPASIDDFQPLPVHLSPNWLGQKFLPGKVGARIADHDRAGVFIGGAASKCASLHYDFQYHSFSFQLFGQKRFWLYSPEQTGLVYPNPMRKGLSRVNDVEQPDLVTFPLFAKARALTCDLQPGEFVFIPGGWWHSTRMLSVSISISINTANASNWRAVTRELYEELKPRHPILARPFALYIRGIGFCKAVADQCRRKPVPIHQTPRDRNPVVQEGRYD